MTYWDNNPKMYEKFYKLMHEKFEISMMDELIFFIRLQVKYLDNEIFTN